MKKILMLTMILFSAVTIFAQKGNDLNLNDPIKADPNVTIGKLDNGMTYYIRRNTYPKDRVEFRLAVNAGSNQENDDQQGLAHFTEHMAFNGIEGFPSNSVVDHLRGKGVVFGADLNAYTSFDETVYMIPMPLDDPANIDLGLKILRGWAHGLLFDNKEIDEERGVIIEEYRLGLGADDRMRKEYWPILMKGSRYADRMPIGLLSILQTFDYQVIKDFYSDWYRPDLQAVIVVGDINVKEVEQKVKTVFGNIPAKQNPRKKETYGIAANKEPLVAVCTDKEATGNQIMLIRKHPHFAMKTIGDFRKQLCIDLYNTMYDARFSEMTQDPKCPFIGASAGYGNFIGNTDMYGSQAIAKENRIPEALKILLQEDNRVLKYGFLQTELDRAKEEILEDYDRAAKEVEKTESARFASQYINNFLRNDPIPGAKRENTYAKKLIEGITLEEINALAKNWVTEDNIVVLVTAPEKEGVNVPSKNEILNIINDKSLANVAPYVDTYKDQEILEKETLKPGKITNIEKIDAVGAEKWTLSNGITVYLKKTDYKNDEILFSATSKGGKSLYDVKDLASADFAADIIDRGGIAGLDFNTLTKKMKGKVVGISPNISLLSEGFSGSSTPKDLEFFFQYLNAFFTNPRIDPNAFELVMDETKEQLKMIQAQPMYKYLGEFLDAAMSHDPYMKQMFSYDDKYLSQVNFDRAVQIYKERFANPADFNFFFVGNYDEKQMKEFVELYLGSMKTTPAKKENYNVNVLKPRPDKASAQTVYAGTEEQGYMGMYITNPIDWSYRNSIIADMVGEALDIQFVRIVREKMGDVYSPMVQMGASKLPRPEMSLMILLGCAPEKTDKLADASLKILNDFKKKGPDKKTMELVKKQMLSTRAKNIQTNRFWLGYISGKIVNDMPMTSPSEYDETVNSITKKDMVEFMKKYFKPEIYTRADMIPTTMQK
ncbi:MAG: insulinase family protein [Bacteroidales bacterium]|nr:insulinase family protein [Bacteroidales bacterium]MDY6347378.1 insulinase family protein [Bacteroidales bacterium]